MHLSQVFLTLGLTFMFVSFVSKLLDDLGSMRIPGRHFHSNAGAADQPNHYVSQARGHSGEHHVPAIQSHPEESAREHLFDRSDSRFLRWLASDYVESPSASSTRAVMTSGFPTPSTRRSKPSFS